MNGSSHVWQFSRVGGVNRVNLETGEDLLALEYLDQKLWTALSCPVHGLEIDPKTLELIDTDHDGKIRVPEVIEAVKWITSVIKDPNELVRRNNSLPLSSINNSTPLGSQLLSSSKQILSNLGKSESQEITVEETSDTISIFAQTKFNGDGVITEDSTDDPEIAKLINDIIQCIGSTPDRSGKDGVSIDQVDSFFKNCEDYSIWQAKAESNNASILPFGEQTEEAFSTYSALKLKIDDYFLRCQMAEFDPQSAEALNSLTARVETINSKDLSNCTDEIAGFPIAKVVAKKPLPFDSGINPVWKDKLLTLKKLAFDSTNEHIQELSEEQWIKLCQKFTAYSTWKQEKVGEVVEILGIKTIRELLLSNKKETILNLIEKDKALEAEANSIILVDQLVRYYRDIYTLLSNFVTFSDFYSPDLQAVFQSGSLYFDQRSCDLCIKVSDMPKHISMAGSSGICLAYCDCYSKSKNEKMTIVAALTDGDVDNLVVGRNAIFYDRKGVDWDATIIKIIDNPISIRQAFWSPYRKTARFINKQVEKVASSKEQEVHTTTTTGVEKATTKLSSGVNEPTRPTSAAEQARPAPFDIAKFAGIFAAIGMAIGAIGTVLASIVGGFLALSWWKMPIAFVGIMLAISGPSMFIAWLKLRKRNLAPVLDANGWAINAKATINIPFGNTLTHLATLPKNSKQNFRDPFTKKKNPWIPIIIITLALIAIIFFLWHYGFLEQWGII